MDGVVSPATAIEIGRLGGVGVLNLEGLWTRYEDPDALLEEIADLDAEKATQRMQDIYQEPIKPELDRRSASARSRTPASSPASRSRRSAPTPSPPTSLEAELDMLVIQGTVVSAEHVSKTVEPLNLKQLRPRARHPGHRRRLRQLPGRPAPHAHRRRRRPRRRRPRPRLHHPRRARHRRPAGDGHRRRPGRPHAPPRRDRRLRPRHRRRRHGHRRRHRQGHRLRRRRRHDRLAAGRGPRGARPGLPLGHGHVPPDAAPRRPGQDRRPGAPSRRSWSARPTRTTAA